MIHKTVLVFFEHSKLNELRGLRCSCCCSALRASMCLLVCALLKTRDGFVGPLLCGLRHCFSLYDMQGM